MLVSITPKGERFYEQNDMSMFDWIVLDTLSHYDDVDIEKAIEAERRKIGPTHAGALKDSFRRLFEAGYIEQIEE